MTPIDWLKELGQLGSDVGAAAKHGLSIAAGDAFDWIMQQIWTSALFILRNVLMFIDQTSEFTVSETQGPVSVLWPMMLWISGVLALGLFFWQLIVAVLRGGQGFVRLLAGPVQYGVALSAAVGLVAAFLAAADGLTTGILQYGLHSDKFADALHAMNLPDAASDTIKAAVLGLFGLAGTFPAAFGMAFEMVLREASIYVLAITIPVLAAGLLARATSSWFWKGCRAIIALILVKPGLALVIVVGVAVEGGAQGFFGLLAGTMILLISLWTPFVLFKLFAFIDPNTDAGGALRDSLADVGASSFGPDSIHGRLGSSLLGNLKDRLTHRGDDDGEDDESSSDDAQEEANVERFDADGAAGASDDDNPVFDEDDLDPAGHNDADDEPRESPDEASDDLADSEPADPPDHVVQPPEDAGTESERPDDDDPGDDDGPEAAAAVVL